MAQHRPRQPLCIQGLLQLHFGYRRIRELLRPDFPGLNHKRVYRLYSEANQAVRRRKKIKRLTSERIPL